MPDDLEAEPSRAAHHSALPGPGPSLAEYTARLSATNYNDMRNRRITPDKPSRLSIFKVSLPCQSFNVSRRTLGDLILTVPIADIAHKLEITGCFVDAKGGTHGFLWNGKKYKQLDAPGAISTVASGINNNGLLSVGWTDSSGHNNEGIYNGKKYIKINVPGALGSYPGGIDLAGDLVYTWQDSAKEYHGALRLGGKYYKFDDPQGKGETYGHGINDHQVVAGVLSQRQQYWRISGHL